MSLNPCRECQKEISTDARMCPHCGAPYPARKEWKGTGIDWKSKTTVYGYPLVHVAFGQDLQRKTRVAKGVIAIGQFAVGVIAIAQFGIGFLFGFGQFILGFTAVAQFAGALLIGVGQFAGGYVAIGQVVFAYYGLAQEGLAKYLWSVERKDAEAVEFFMRLIKELKSLW